MVRVAGVKAQIISGYQSADASGLTPTALFAQLQEKIHKFVEKTIFLLPTFCHTGP